MIEKIMRPTSVQCRAGTDLVHSIGAVIFVKEKDWEKGAKKPEYSIEVVCSQYLNGMCNVHKPYQKKKKQEPLKSKVPCFIYEQFQNRVKKS